MDFQEIDFSGKKALIRVDFNVPLDKEGKITDDARIRAALPTIEKVFEGGGAAILLSHLGRPKGKDPALSLKPVAARLAELLGRKVIMAPDVVGPAVQKLAKELKPGEVLLLENLRYYPAEKKPEEDPGFAKELASYGDIYINDAFGSAHRAHTSTVTLAEYFPNAAAPGLLMAKEMKAFTQVLENPKHPFFALIGGAKISSKIGVLQALSKRVDGMVIIGAMAHTFLKALGISVGASLVEEEFVEEAKAIMQACKERGIFLLLPKDEVAVKEGEIIVVDFSEGGIPEGFQGLDIGPKTVAEIREVVKDAGTLFWNGPAGVFEDERFSKGTEEVGKALAESCAFTIVGGGDSVAALNKLNLADKMTHISTGGGASIELIEKGTLPGIAILNCKINLR